MRWLAALAVGISAVTALCGLFYGQVSFDDWQSSRDSNLALIASIEADPGFPNRDGNLQSARELLELANGVAIEKVGLSVLALALAFAVLIPSWRYASRFFSRARLVLLAVAGALIPLAVGGVVVLLLAAGTIRG